VLYLFIYLLSQNLYGRGEENFENPEEDRVTSPWADIQARHSLVESIIA
jgi:hypothetical protein